jgi:hypothetical protein
VTSKETRGEKRAAGRRIQTGLAPANPPHFGTQTEGEGIPGRFSHVVQDVFAILLAVGILNGRIDLGEYTQVV